MSEITLAELEEQVIEIICKITGMEKEEIKKDKHLYLDLNIDSIKAIELVVGVQEKFKIRIDDSKLESLTTVTSIAEEIKRLLGKKNN